MAKADSELDPLTGANLATTDIRAITDVSDTTQAITGSTKKITVAEDMLGLWRLYPEKVSFVIDGNGATITTGIRGDWIVPFACTILGVTAVADQSGSIVVDLWEDTYANYPPTDADTITASAPVTISSATKSQDTTLTGWDTALAAGSIVRFNVDSVTSIQRVTITLDIQRTA